MIYVLFPKRGKLFKIGKTYHGEPKGVEPPWNLHVSKFFLQGHVELEPMFQMISSMG